MPKKQKWYEKEIQGNFVLPAISFSVLFIYTIIISYIPRFLTQIYNPPLMVDQPFSTVVEKNLPISPIIISPIFLGFFSTYFYFAPIEFYSGTFFALIILLDVSMMSNITLTSASSLQSLFVLISLACAHRVFYYYPNNFVWFLSAFLTWAFIYFEILFNLDCVGVVITLTFQSLIYSIFVFPKSDGKKQQKSTFMGSFLKFLKAFCILIVPNIIFFCSICYIYQNVILTPYHLELIDFKLLLDEIKKTESVSFLIILICSIVAPIFLDFHHDMLIPFFALIFGDILTLFIPVQTNGDTIPRKIHFAKIQLLLAVGLITGSLKNEWYSRGFIALYVICGFITKLIWLKNEALTQPPMYRF